MKADRINAKGDDPAGLKAIQSDVSEAVQSSRWTSGVETRRDETISWSRTKSDGVAMLSSRKFQTSACGKEFDSPPYPNS